MTEALPTELFAPGHPYSSGMTLKAVTTIGLLVATFQACAFGSSEVPSLQPTPASSELTRDVIQSYAGVKAVTRPSRDATMGFSLATRVMQVLVAGGEDVRKGQILLRGDDNEDSVVVKLQEIRAKTDLPVQKAAKAADLAKLEYAKLVEAAKISAAASPIEVDRARLTADSAVIDRDTAAMQQEQEVIQVERLKARLDKLVIRAPFDGQIDAVMADVGQSTSENDKVVRVVNIDTLWLDVATPTGMSVDLGLKPGDPAWVLMELPGTPVVRRGKVVEVAPTADSASGTRRVRVEVRNSERVVAGVTSWVRFTEPTGEWKGKIAPLASTEPSTSGETARVSSATTTEAPR